MQQLYLVWETGTDFYDRKELRGIFFDRDEAIIFANNFTCKGNMIEVEGVSGNNDYYKALTTHEFSKII